MKAALAVSAILAVLAAAMFAAYMDLANKYADLKEKYALLNQTYVMKFLNYTAEYAKLRMEYEGLKLNYSMLKHEYEWVKRNYEKLSSMYNKSRMLCEATKCFSGSGKLRAEAKVYCSWFSCSVNVTVTNISNEPVGEAAVIILPYFENGTLYFIPSFHAETVENIGPGESVELEFTLIPLNVSKVEVLVAD